MTTETYDRSKDLPDLAQNDRSAGLPDLKKKDGGTKPAGVLSAIAGAEVGLGTQPTPLSTSPLVSGLAEIENFRNILEERRKKSPPVKKTSPEAIDLAYKVAMGDIDGEYLSQEYKSSRSGEVVDRVIQEYAPDLATGGMSSEDDWDELAKRIKTKNRINAVATRDNYYNKLDADISNAVSNYNISRRVTKVAGRGSIQSEEQIPLSIANINNPNQYENLMNLLVHSDNITDKEGKVIPGERERLIDAITQKKKIETLKQGVSPEVQSLDKKTKDAIARANIDREKGENIPINEFALNDDVNQKHFELGLSLIQKTQPGRYKNVVKVIEAGKNLPDDDFRTISDAGQEIYNGQVFFGAANDPSLLDKETDLDYTTRGDKKAVYAGIIAERLKNKTGLNTRRQYKEAEIKSVSADLENQSIVEELIQEEKLPFYDAIPKYGPVESFVQGLGRPIESIRETARAITTSPVDYYIRSKKLDTGLGQKVFDEKGQASEVIPSERENMFYSAIRGFGEFIPQIILAKGIGGGITKAVTGVGVKLSPVAQAAVTNYGGTVASTYLQEFGNSYADYLQKTGDPATARLAANIDSGNASAWEMLLPDVKIADKAFGGLRRELVNDIVDLVKKGGDPAALKKAGRGFIEKFFTEAVNISGQEVAEEVGTNYVDVLTETIFSPLTAASRDAHQEAIETAKQTAIQMSIPAILGGAGAGVNGDFTTNAFHSAAINVESYKQTLTRALNNGSINQDTYNKSLSLLQSHKESITNTPKTDINDKPLSDADHLAFALEETKIKGYKAKAEKLDGPAKEVWETKIKQSQEVQRNILMPKVVAKEKEFVDKWKANIAAIEERTDITPEEKERLKQAEDVRHAQELSDLQAERFKPNINKSKTEKDASLQESQKRSEETKDGQKVQSEGDGVGKVSEVRKEETLTAGQGAGATTVAAPFVPTEIEKLNTQADNLTMEGNALPPEQMDRKQELWAEAKRLREQADQLEAAPKEGVVPSYPLEDKNKWESFDETSNNAPLTYISPDEFLSKAEMFEMTEKDRERVDKIKEHILSGKKLDPLKIFSNERLALGANTDGRHRAVAAKELGIKEVPVLDFTKPKAEGVVPSLKDVGGILKENGFVVSDKGGYDKNGINIAFKKSSVLGVDKHGDPFFVDSPHSTDIVLQEIKIVDESVRGKGDAGKALKDFLDAADKTGSTIYLEPEPIARLKNEKNLSREQLIGWYEKNGFKKVNESIWKREPQQQTKPIEGETTAEKPKAQPVVSRPAISVEPPTKKGRTPVTVSGNTEQERQELIKQRKKDTYVPTVVVDEQKLLDRVESFNKGTKNQRNGFTGRAEVNAIKLAVDQFNRNHNKKYTAVQNRTGQLEFRRDDKKKIVRNNKASGDLSIDETGVPLMQRSDKTKQVFTDLLDNETMPTGMTVDGRRMAEAQLDGAIQDILDGIPSRAANNYLNALEKMIEKDDFDFSKPGEPQQDKVTLETALKLGKQQVGEPMTEQAVMDWLNEQGELTPDQEQTVIDNIENLITEYEQGYAIVSDTGQIPTAPKEGERTSDTTAEPDQQPETKPDAETTPATKAEPTVEDKRNEKIEKFDSKVDRVIDALIDFATPKTVIPGTQKQGLGVAEILRAGGEVIKQAYRLEQNIEKAIAKGIEEMKALWTNAGLTDPFPEDGVRNVLEKEFKDLLAPQKVATAQQSADDTFISGVLNKNIDATKFPTIFANNAASKQLTAVTQGEGQNRNVDGDYVEALQDNLREISIQSSAVLKNKFGDKWAEKTVSWLERNPNEGALEQIVGVLGVMSTDNFQEIANTNDARQLSKLTKLQNRIDKLTNKNSRIASLALRQRKLYKTFAQGQNMQQIFMQANLSPEMIELQDELNALLAEGATEDEINAATPKAPPPPKKSGSLIRNVIKKAKQQASATLKDELKAKAADVSAKGGKSLKELINEANEKIKNTKC